MVSMVDVDQLYSYIEKHVESYLYADKKQIAVHEARLSQTLSPLVIPKAYSTLVTDFCQLVNASLKTTATPLLDWLNQVSEQLATQLCETLAHMDIVDSFHDQIQLLAALSSTLSAVAARVSATEKRALRTDLGSFHKNWITPAYTTAKQLQNSSDLYVVERMRIVVEGLVVCLSES